MHNTIQKKKLSITSIKSDRKTGTRYRILMLTKQKTTFKMFLGLMSEFQKWLKNYQHIILVLKTVFDRYDIFLRNRAELDGWKWNVNLLYRNVQVMTWNMMSEGSYQYFGENVKVQRGWPESAVNKFSIFQRGIRKLDSEDMIC